MRHYSLHPMIFLVMLCSGIMCKQEKANPPTLTGKMVLESPCSPLIIQVLKGSIEPYQLDPLWKDSVNGVTYINVFTVGNRCTFPGGFSGGDTITFQLDANPPPPSPLCDLCIIAGSPAPPVYNAVYNVQKAK